MVARFHKGQTVHWWYRRPRNEPPNGTGKVTAIEHADSKNPRYSIAEEDHHKGEPEIVHHRQSDMTAR